jgi:hypothetical protein
MLIHKIYNYIQKYFVKNSAYNHNISVLHQATGNVMNRLTHFDVPVAFILYFIGFTAHEFVRFTISFTKYISLFIFSIEAECSVVGRAF